MICSKCGHNMSEGSAFCMNCGNKVETIQKEGSVSESIKVTDAKICKKCGKRLEKECVFCPDCGDKQIVTKNKSLVVAVNILVVILLVIAGITVYKNNLKSSIEGVSQKVYSQGMKFLEEMESWTTKEAVMSYVSNCEDEELDDIYLHVDTVNFQIVLGQKPTDEELYFSRVITKFWESWAICYSHESIIAEYENSNETGIQMATSMYKGLVSGFKDEIAEAKETLKKASDMYGMEESYEILTDIWDGED